MTGRVVVLRALGLGDLLTAVPALRGLRRATPCHRLTLCAPGHLAPLAALTDAVDEVCPMGPLQPIDPRLKGAEVAVNMHGRGPQSHRLLAAVAPRRMIAFRNQEVPWSRVGPAWKRDEHEVQRWCRLLESYGIACDPSDLGLRIPGAVRDPSLTVVHPGAASPSRRWPAERFAAVVRHERETGRRVVLTGGAAERELALRVAAAGGLSEHCVAAGTTSLMQLVRLIAAAGRVVCGDTGPAHLATALQTPSVVLFGPTSPAAWGPPSDPRHRVLWHGTNGDPHADVADPGLLAISVDEVLCALASLPGDGSPASRSSAASASAFRRGALIAGRQR